MNPHDPRLSAYLLGELSAAEAAEIEQAAAAQPAVRAALDELKPVMALLYGTLPAASPAPALTAAQQARVRAQSRQPAKVPASNIVRFVLPALAAAACVAIGVSIFMQQPAQHAVADAPSTSPKHDADKTLRVRLMPRSAPRDSTQLPSARTNDAMANFTVDNARPDLAQFLPVPVSEANELLLPMLASNSSLQWIAAEIREKKTLPQPGNVRVAELVNSHALKPAGKSASSDGVLLAAESLACPWKPSASLQLIRVQGADAGPRQVRTALKFNPATVASYRVLGFAPVSNSGAETALPEKLAAKQATNVLVEVQPTATAGEMGKLQLAVQNGQAVELALPAVSANPSEDARFATLLAAYGLWLAKDPEQRALGSDFLAAMVREFDLEKLSAERRDTLRLIQQSLALQK